MAYETWSEYQLAVGMLQTQLGIDREEIEKILIATIQGSPACASEVVQHVMYQLSAGVCPAIKDGQLILVPQALIQMAQQEHTRLMLEAWRRSLPWWERLRLDLEMDAKRIKDYLRGR